MVSATRFACQWVYRQNVLRLQQLQVLFGSAAVWLQVAFVPLLLILPLPILRLLEPGYDASSELHALVVALLCWQSIGRLPAPTSAQRWGWQLLWPTPSQQRVLQWLPALLSQWPFWIWSLLAFGLALGFANGALAWPMFSVWLVLVALLALLSVRYCPFVISLCTLPWLSDSHFGLLPVLLLVEWLCWQMVASGGKALAAKQQQRFSSRSLLIGFITKSWRGQGAVPALLCLIVFCQWQRFDQVFVWSMLCTMAFACLHLFYAFVEFGKQYALSLRLLWPTQTIWRLHLMWFGVSLLLLAPWLWLIESPFAAAWLLLVATSSFCSRSVGFSLFVIGAAALSITAYVVA